MTRNLAIVVDFLREQGIEIPDDVRCHRTRAGYWQRSRGAWSWCLDSRQHNVPPIGSQWPLSECAAAAKRGTLACDQNDFTFEWHLTPEEA